MMYVDFTAGNREYKLRLNTRNMIALERQLGCSPLAIFGNGDEIPTITTMVNILYASAQQYNHGITLDRAYDIFDEYLEDGHQITDFLGVIVDIYKVSGLIKGTSGDQSEKN